MKAPVFPATRSHSAAKRSKAAQFQASAPYSTQYWHHSILRQALRALIARRCDAQSQLRSRSFSSLPAEPAAALLVLEGNAYIPAQPYQAVPAFVARDAGCAAVHPAGPAHRAVWPLPVLVTETPAYLLQDRGLVVHQIVRNRRINRYF